MSMQLETWGQILEQMILHDQEPENRQEAEKERAKVKKRVQRWLPTLHRIKTMMDALDGASFFHRDTLALFIVMMELLEKEKSERKKQLDVVFTPEHEAEISEVLGAAAQSESGEGVI
jgi:hypothetical protein